MFFLYYVHTFKPQNSHCGGQMSKDNNFSDEFYIHAQMGLRS